MSPISVCTFSVMVITGVVLFSDMYSRLHLGRQAWIVITSIAAAVFVIGYILEKTVYRKKTED